MWASHYPNSSYLKFLPAALAKLHPFIHSAAERTIGKYLPTVPCIPELKRTFKYKYLYKKHFPFCAHPGGNLSSKMLVYCALKNKQINQFNREAANVA